MLEGKFHATAVLNALSKTDMFTKLVTCTYCDIWAQSLSNAPSL